MIVRPSFRVLILLVAQAASAEVGWVQLSPGCRVRPLDIQPGNEEPQIVACGGAGVFLFGGPGLIYDGECPAVDGGTETPALIPVEPPPRVSPISPTLPCYQGSCLGRSYDRPWVAVLDWRTAHGWSVAATVREASDERVDVELYDLAAVGGIAPLVPSVSDLHVLVQLCAVAEAAQGNDRPLAINMSFGRRGTGKDCKSGSNLGCSVSRVLSYLEKEEGIQVVAAAGNHHEMLFPASSPGVISAGALDLAYLEQNQVARASAQTPPAAKALMVGYGLYLSEEGGDRYSPVWPAPPGSSYAAALFTGWLGGTLAAGDGHPLPAGTRWAPMTTANGLALALDGVPLAGSELAGPRRLLERAMGEVPVSLKQGAYVTLRLDGPAPPLPELSVLHADSGNGPQPGVNPCVPCQGGGELGAMNRGDAGDAVLVDLSYSAGLPPGTDMVAVLLRVGGEVYAFEGSRDPDLMAAMAAGQVEGLVLSEVGGIFVPGAQASLVLVVSVGGSAYWHEVPLNLHR
jgi:hypothetical protein